MTEEQVGTDARPEDFVFGVPRSAAADDELDERLTSIREAEIAAQRAAAGVRIAD